MKLVMKFAWLLYFSLTLIILGTGVSALGQSYVIKGTSTKQATVQFPVNFPIAGATPVPFDVAPGSSAIDCSDPMANCWSEEQKHSDPRYRRVKITDPQTGKQRVGWMFRDDLKVFGQKPEPKSPEAKAPEPKKGEAKKLVINLPAPAPDPDPAPVPKTQACWYCIFSSDAQKEPAQNTNSIFKHDEAQKEIVSNLRSNPFGNPFDDEICGDKKKPIGENLWNLINKKRSKGVTVCNEAKKEFLEKCDLLAGKTIRERIQAVVTRIQPVLNSLPKELKPSFMNRDLIACIIKREDRYFVPAQPSDRSCSDKKADDFGLGQMKRSTLSDEWRWYKLDANNEAAKERARGRANAEIERLNKVRARHGETSKELIPPFTPSKVIELQRKFGTSDNFYYSLGNYIDEQIKGIALLLNMKFSFGERSDECDLSPPKGNPLTKEQIKGDEKRGKPAAMFRKTLRRYDACGKRGYVEDIFSCVDKLRGKTDSEVIDILTPKDPALKRAKNGGKR